MNEEFCTDYKDGDIVWVKLGPSWWPGEVKDLNKIPSEEIEFKKPPLVVVQFFEEDTYEYVRSWSNIYPFNSEKKVDFIKKGMAAFHSKASHMEKFPKDVVAAEVKIGGNSNILSDPAYRIEVKRSYASDNTSSPNMKKRSKEGKKGRNTSHVTHRRFLGCDDYKAYICIQYPGKDRTPGDSEDEEIIRINTEPEQEYNCHSCSYSTKRLEVMILHTKSHIQGHYVSSPKRKRPVVPKPTKKESTKKQRPPTLSWSHDSSSDEISEPPKEKKRKTKSVSSKKAAAEIAEVKPKKASEICNDLLAEWDDETDEEVGLENTFDVTATNENDETKNETNEVLKNGEDNIDTVDTDVTENEHKDACVEVTEEDPKSKETSKPTMDQESSKLIMDQEISKPTMDQGSSLPTMDQESSEPTMDQENSKPTMDQENSKPTMDQETQEAIKSCFDFEEDEEEELINTPAIEGRKIPRVIPPTEKRKSEILDDIIDLEEGIDKEEILKVSQSFNERKSENIELENVFKDFMDEVAVPKLPEVKTNLKPTQNFHCVKTIKFPDKLDEPPQKDRDKNDAKLINPKKRFVKSFEDFENQLHKEEIKRKEEDELNRKKIKENLFNVKQIDEDSDSDNIKVDIGHLQCTIMSRIIDEINISDESKHSIMSKLHKKKSPRGKILDSYLSVSASTSQSEDVDPKQVTEDISLPGTSKDPSEAKTRQSDKEETDSSSIKNKGDRRSSFLESTNENIDEDEGAYKTKLNKKLRKRSFNVEKKEETATKDDQSKFRKTRHPSTETRRLSTDGNEDKTETNADHPCFDKHKSTTDQTIRKLSFRLSLSEPRLNEEQDDANKSETTDINDEKEDQNEKTTRSSRRKFQDGKTLETDERTKEVEVLKSKIDQNGKTAGKTVRKRTTRFSSVEKEAALQITPENSNDESKNDETKDSTDNSGSKTEKHYESETTVVESLSDKIRAKHDKHEDMEHKKSPLSGIDSLSEGKDNEDVKTGVSHDEIEAILTKDEEIADKTGVLESHMTEQMVVVGGSEEVKTDMVEQTTDRIRQRSVRKSAIEEEIDKNDDITNKLKSLFENIDDADKDEDKTVHKRSSRHSSSGKHRTLSAKVTARKRSGRKSSEKHRVQEDLHDEIEEVVVPLQSSTESKIEQLSSDGDVSRKNDEIPEKTVRKRSSRHFFTGKHRALKTDDFSEEILTKDTTEPGELEEVTSQKIEQATDRTTRRRSSRPFPSERNRVLETAVEIEEVAVTSDNKNEESFPSETKTEHLSDDKVDETTDKALRRRSLRHSLPVKVDPVEQASGAEYLSDEKVKHDQTKDDEHTIDKNERKRSSSQSLSETKTDHLTDDKVDETTDKALLRRSLRHSLPVKIDPVVQASGAEYLSDEMVTHDQTKDDEHTVDKNERTRSSSQSSSDTKTEHLTDDKVNETTDKALLRRSSRHSLPVKIDPVVQASGAEYLSDEMVKHYEDTVDKNEHERSSSQSSSETKIEHSTDEETTVRRRSSRHFLPVKVDHVLQASEADEIIKDKQTNDDEDNVERKRSSRHSSGKYRTLKTKVDDEIKNAADKTESKHIYSSDVNVTDNLPAEIAVDKVNEKNLTTDRTASKRSCKSSSDKIEESKAPEIAIESNSSQSSSETKIEHLPDDFQINMVKDEEIAYKTVHRRSSRHSSSEKHREFKKIVTDNLSVDEIEQKRSSRYCASKSEQLPHEIEVVVAKDDENWKEQKFPSDDIDVITTKDEDRTMHKRSSRHSSSGKHRTLKTTITDNFSDEVKGVVDEIERKRSSKYCLDEKPQTSLSAQLPGEIEEAVTNVDKNDITKEKKLSSDDVDVITTKDEDRTKHKRSSRRSSSGKHRTLKSTITDNFSDEIKGVVDEIDRRYCLTETPQASTSISEHLPDEIVADDKNEMTKEKFSSDDIDVITTKDEDRTKHKRSSRRSSSGKHRTLKSTITDNFSDEIKGVVDEIDRRYCLTETPQASTSISEHFPDEIMAKDDKNEITKAPKFSSEDLDVITTKDEDITVHKRSLRYSSSGKHRTLKTKVADSHKIQDDDNKNMGDEVTVPTVEEIVDKSGLKHSFSESTLKIDEHVLDEIEKVVATEDDRCEETKTDSVLGDGKETAITEEDLDKETDKLAISDEITHDDQKERIVVNLEDNSSKKTVRKGKFWLLSSREQEPLDNKVEHHQHEMIEDTNQSKENKVSEERQETSQNSSMEEQQGIQIVEQLKTVQKADETPEIVDKASSDQTIFQYSLMRSPSGIETIDKQSVQTNDELQKQEIQIDRKEEEVSVEKTDKKSLESTEPKFNTEPQTITTSLKESQATDKEIIVNKSDLAATLENRQKLRLPFKKGRWSIRTSHPKKYINIETVSSFRIAEADKIKTNTTNESPSKPTTKDNVEILTEGINLDKNETGDDSLVSQTDTATVETIPSLETIPITENEVKLTENVNEVTVEDVDISLSEEKPTEDESSSKDIENVEGNTETKVDEGNFDHSDLNLNTSQFSELCSQNEEFSVENTSLELPEYAICEPSTKFNKRKRSRRLPKLCYKKKRKQSEDLTDEDNTEQFDEETNAKEIEDENVPITVNQEVVNDSTIETVEEETIFEVTIEEDSVHTEEKLEEVIGNKKENENNVVVDGTSEKGIEAEEFLKSESIIEEAVITNEEPLLAKEEIAVEEIVSGENQVSSNEENILFDSTPTFSFGCNKDPVVNEQNDFGEYQNLLESSKKSNVKNEDKQSIESKFNDMPADDEDEKLTDLVSDIVQKLNRDESDKNQEELDMELEEEMRLSPKSPKIKVKEATLEPAIEEKTKSEVIEKDKLKNVDNDEEKIPNEVEIFCASNSNDTFKFCIQTNLSNLSRSEEISAIALATLSEVQSENRSNTTEEIAPKVDLPSPEKLSDTEMAAIEGNLTVMSEKDLADAQVEITSEKVISCKKPVMLSSFSMDFSESSQTTTEPRKYKDIDPKGTEFTSRAITKEFKPKSHTKKMNTYNQCELLNILEGNADAEKKIVEFQTPAKSFTGDICDFEEHIPSQIVCTKQFKQDLDDEFKKKDKSSVISTTSKLLERLTEIKTDTKKETPTETVTKTIKPKPKLRPIILSEQIIKPASDPKKIIQLSSNLVNDIEDVEAFIIRKDIKKHVEAEETVPAAKHTRKPRQKPLGKANILQQTIITPAGEIIQPATAPTLPKMKTVLVNAPAASISTRTPAENPALIELNKTSKSTVTATANAEGTNQDDNVFDIFNMPIVLSDQILTPESIENMPIVIENNEPINKPKPIVQPTKIMPSKALTKIVSTGKTTVVSTKGTNVPAKLTKPKILQTTTKSVTPNILSRSTKPGKYILVSQSSGIAQHPKKTVIKKTSLPANLPTKLSGASEGAGHKIMVVTNQQGQQQRLLLTPAQQKVLGYQPSIGQKIEKPVIKTDILHKTLTTAALKPEIGGIKSSTTQKIITSASQVIAGVTTSRSIKPVLKRAPSSPSSQKLTSPKTTKTILITNKHGQTIKKIATTEDDIDKQVAEQLEAIKASSGMHFSSQSKSEPVANKLLQKPPAPKKYNRKQESKFKTTPVSTKSEIPQNPILPSATSKKIIPHVPETKKVIQEEPKPQIDRPLNQLVIQDALGNQTTITEGQILALPSETVDGQPQSYMLVTLDQAGNLTPLNNEALMSLDPNLGLGGDLSNIVLQIDQGALGTGNINQPTPLAQPATVKITNPGEQLQAGTSKIEIPRETVPLSLPVANEVPIVEQKIEENIMVAPTEAAVNIVSNSNGDQGQQLIVTGDPIATQKFLESLSEGTTDLANIIANAEGKSILIQADGQQILINTNTDSQMLTNVVESTEGDGNPVFATQPSKNTDILAAALADTDVFSTQTKVSSQLSPNNALYPINVSNVLETSLTLNSPIMTPLEVPSSNSKKIPDDVVDILTQVPKNVDLPITITDPNISQTVANQQVANLISNEFQANLELGLSIPEATITAVSTGLSSPGYNYSLSSLDDNDMTHKPFNSSMPLLNDDVEDGLTVKKSDKDDDKNMGTGSFLGEESRFTLGGGMCSSLSEPPPEMFDIPDNAYGEKNGNNIPLSLQSTPDPKDDDGSIQTESSSEGSCEIPLQPKIFAKSADLSEVNDI